HAGHSLGGGKVEAHNGTARDRALHDDGMREVVDRKFGSVFGAAGDLEAAVAAVEGQADGRHCLPPYAVTVSRARGSARCISGTLNPFSGSGCAPSPAWATAAAIASDVAGAPASAASTCGSRHGRVPTPPIATRAARIRSPSRATTTAAETSANSKEARSRS